MKRSDVGSTAGLVLMSAAMVACAPGEGAVRIQAARADGIEAQGVADVEVSLLPYDRDQVFDSLSQAFPTPEPEMPPDLAAAQEGIAAARQAWADAETRWNVLRDDLQKLNDRMEGLNRSTREYRSLFSEHQQKFREYEGLDARVASLFNRFQSLQAAVIGRLDSMSVARSNWADEAFQDVNEVIAAKIDASGLEMHVDTTDADGWVFFRVPPGDYWVYARHEVATEEWYWNRVLQLPRGLPQQLLLSRNEADVRPIY